MSGVTHSRTNEVNTCVKEIKEKANAKMVSGLDEESQYELARILNLIPFFYKYEKLVDNLHLIEVSANSLLTDKPNIKFANAIRIDLERLCYDIKDEERNWWSIWKYTPNPTSRLLTGLVTNMVLAIFYGLYFLKLYNSDPNAMIFGIFAYKIAVVTIMGMFGGIVSIMLRIRDYNDYRGEYGSTLFFIGFTKPLIGAMLSLFILTIISSEILPFDYNLIQGKAFYFFSAISFVTGLSERFARDLIKKTEEAIL